MDEKIEKVKISMCLKKGDELVDFEVPIDYIPRIIEELHEAYLIATNPLKSKKYSSMRKKE